MNNSCRINKYAKLRADFAISAISIAELYIGVREVPNVRCLT
jgi:hypothetical protein